MKQFDIFVRTVAGSNNFKVKPTSVGGDIQYEIWENNNHLFTLECCSDMSGRTLKLTDKYSDKEIYPGLVQALSNVIFKE